MNTGKITLFPITSTFGRYQAHTAPSVLGKITNNSIEAHIKFSIYEGMEFVPGKVDDETYRKLRDKYEYTQKQKTRIFLEKFRELFKCGDGRILFVPKYCPATLYRLLQCRKQQPGPIVLKFLENKNICISCDCEGHALYGPGKIYQWDNMIVEISNPRDAKKYIYDQDDRTIETLYPELEKIVAQMRPGIEITM